MCSSDLFKPPPKLRHEMSRYAPPDKMFFTHPRFETFGANVTNGKGGKVVALRMECLEGARQLHREGLRPGLVYVDFEKNENRLVRTLRELMEMFPRATIVGDDHVFRPVVRAARRVSQEAPHAFEARGSAYIFWGPDATPVRTRADPRLERDPTAGDRVVYSAAAQTPYDKHYATSSFSL